MGHIHDKPGQHDLTASAVIFRIDLTEPKVLLHRHKKLNKYLQFGGHVELDETPWQTMVRELREESGYEPDQLKLLQPKLRLKHQTDSKLHPYPLSIVTHSYSSFDHSHTDIKFVFVAKDEPKHKVEERESKDIRLFTKAEFMDLDSNETYPNMKELVSFAFDNILGTWEEVDLSDFVL